ncbi:MAG: hypothetical protein U5K73_09745 [Halofilum sp. (in: g-proteobacteria)]|nr:hypothetical protein [Halofilum sp. (in: g-proteobacteria)]
MRVGMLQCDSVAADLRVEFGDYPEMLRRLFANRAKDLSFGFIDLLQVDSPTP